MSGAVEEHTQLDPRAVTLWRQQGLLVTAAVAVGFIGATIAAALADGSALALGAIGLVVTVAVGAFAMWFPMRRYSLWSYRLDPVALEIRRGAFIRRRSVIPYFRVQHVDTSIGPLERRLGLAELKIHTASSATDASIPAIDAAVAAELRAVIVSRVGMDAGV